MPNIDEKKKTLPPFNISSFLGRKKTQHFSSETLTSSQFLKCRKSCYMFCFCYTMYIISCAARILTPKTHLQTIVIHRHRT